MSRFQRRATGVGVDQPEMGQGLACMERIDTGGGFSVLDGVALVMGSAIASIHVLRVMRGGLTGAGWIMLWLTFAWVAVTAAGPFLYLARRFGRRLKDYPGVGDRLWAILGIPWLVTAVIQSATAGGSEPRQNPLFATTLVVGIGLACLIALGVVWSTWVVVPPGEAARVEASPWTNRVGLVLAITWPVQCGLGLVVLS
ncbi:MAG: hypothetical protein ACYC61_09530 [Isosphaeraceae bacterium]